VICFHLLPRHDMFKLVISLFPLVKPYLDSPWPFGHFFPALNSE